MFKDFSAKKVEIYSVLGQKISVKDFEGQSIDLDILTLEKGIYFLKIKSGSKETTKKFIKE